MWTRVKREYAGDHTYGAWAADGITSGVFNVREQQLGVPGDVRGLDGVEFGCWTAYFSAWLAKRGARERSGISFPLIEADAGDVPLPPGSFDLAVLECGASLWSGPARWLPGAARLLTERGQGDGW